MLNMNLRRGVVRCQIAATPAIARRTFYEKLKQDGENSERGPSQMFSDFVRNPSAQKVPETLHKTNREAVGKADKLILWFTMFSVVFFTAVLVFINPARGDDLEPPEGKGYISPLDPRGSIRYSK